MIRTIFTMIGLAACIFAARRFPADPFSTAEGGGIPMGWGVAWGIGLATLFFLGLGLFLGRELERSYSDVENVRDAIMEFSLMAPVVVAIVTSLVQ